MVLFYLSCLVFVVYSWIRDLGFSSTWLFVSHLIFNIFSQSYHLLSISGILKKHTLGLIISYSMPQIVFHIFHLSVSAAFYTWNKVFYLLILYLALFYLLLTNLLNFKYQWLFLIYTNQNMWLLFRFARAFIIVLSDSLMMKCFLVDFMILDYKHIFCEALFVKILYGFII